MSAIKQKKKNVVCVIGIGRVGLPFALSMCEEGFTVYGIGRDKEKIENINKGKMPFIEDQGPKLLKKHVGKHFFATTEYECIKKSSYIILTLGTPVDDNMNPVYDQILMAIEKSLPYFNPNQILILRSTVSPKTTSYVKNLIEKKSALKVGKNFFLAFCPERISEGHTISEIKQLPQIIGADDKKSSKLAITFFKRLGISTMPTDTVSAELGKLFTNMYRYVNFAVANEFMILAKKYDRDIYAINNLVNKNYKRGGLMLPGLSGGPCLFKDGFFLISGLPFADLVLTSWKINESIPIILVEEISKLINLENKKVVILGLAFKAESDDIRESLSFKAKNAFLREGAKVELHDPFITSHKSWKIEKNVYESLKNADVIFIATNHKIYKRLQLKRIKKIVNKNCIVGDVWNVLGTGKIVYKINDENNLGLKNSPKA